MLACTAAHCHSGTDTVSAAAIPFAAPSTSAMVSTIATAAGHHEHVNYSKMPRNTARRGGKGPETRQKGCQSQA